MVQALASLRWQVKDIVSFGLEFLRLAANEEEKA
jgi:hypothetical protein